MPNPITAPGGLASIFTNKAVFNGLVRYNSKTLNPEGDLAEKWEVGADGKEMTFTLRPNVKWHDGQPFTADDVKFTFDTMLDTKVNARFRSNIKGVNAAVVNSPTSVTLKLDTPLPSLPIQLGYNIHMIPKHLARGQDINAPKDFLAKPIGTGPFKFVEYTPGSTLTVERYDGFHFGAPLLDRIQFKVVAGHQRPTGATEERRTRLRADGTRSGRDAEGRHEYRHPERVAGELLLHRLQQRPPTVQGQGGAHALGTALDRASIVKDVLGGAGQVANGPINPLLAWAYTDDVPKVSYDPKAAGAMLDARGLEARVADGIRAKDGQKLSFELIVDQGQHVPREHRADRAAGMEGDWRGCEGHGDGVQRLNRPLRHQGRLRRHRGVLHHAAGPGCLRVVLHRRIEQPVEVLEPDGG